MSQLSASYTSKGSTTAKDPTSLQKYLSKHNVPDKVYGLLQSDNISLGELTTFTNEDLKDWCVEHELKTLERRRFINAIENLDFTKKEKENLKQIEQINTNINEMIKDSKTSIESTIEEINTVCDKIQAFVETLRKSSVKKV